MKRLILFLAFLCFALAVPIRTPHAQTNSSTLSALTADTGLTATAMDTSASAAPSESFYHRHNVVINTFVLIAVIVGAVAYMNRKRGADFVSANRPSGGGSGYDSSDNSETRGRPGSPSNAT